MKFSVLSESFSGFSPLFLYQFYLCSDAKAFLGWGATLFRIKLILL